MAGIGFELKKIFVEKGLLANIRAYFYSIFVTIGPIIISVLVITTMQFILKAMGVNYLDMELLQATIMYSFIFSVILSSGFCMIISRYVSDLLYLGKENDVLPTLIGSIATISVVAGIIGIIFYWKSPINIIYKFCAYLLFVELTIEIVLSIYVSAVENYKRVAYSFLISTGIAIILAYILIKFNITSEILAILIAFDVCIAIVILMLSLEVQSYFVNRSDNYFNFISYFEDYFYLLLTNVFFTMALYAHNFAFWNYDKTSRLVQETYLYSPFYDIPSFYAFLSITPTLVIFAVQMETAFYEKYRDYFYLINNGACYEDIEEAKKSMKKVMFKELLYVMEMQLFFSFAFIILGMLFLPKLGFTNDMIDTYNLVLVGYYCVIIFFVIMTVLLYFDAKRMAAILAGSLMFLSFTFTQISIDLGIEYFGLGYFIAGLVMMIVGIITLSTYVNNIDYNIFCKQVVWKNKETSVLKKLLDKPIKK